MMHRNVQPNSTVVLDAFDHGLLFRSPIERDNVQAA